MNRTKSIMLQGTSSNVGKSVLCAALCRVFYQDGFKTAPFKAQNMALNSTVTPDGGEIGRAQGAQAEAAGIQPTADMNPILIKPKEDMQAQIIVRGQSRGEMSARDYRDNYLPQAVPVVMQSIEKLKKEYEILVIEGAGSPAEINLKDRDIVNMKTAQLAKAPVILVADIDRGGVFAALVGTLELLEPHERERVKGFIINKFRGDLDLLKPGLEFLEKKTGIGVLGIVPYMHDHGIDEEDSVGLDRCRDQANPGAPVKIAVVQLPRISNFTDISPFLNLPDTGVRFVKKGEQIGSADVVIVPATKNPLLDLLYLKEQGYDQEIKGLAAEGKYITGICEGYQMLGEKLHHPGAGEGAPPETYDGLGLLPAVTTYHAGENTHQVNAVITAAGGLWASLKGQQIRGYEIRTGRVELAPGSHSLLAITTRSNKKVDIPNGSHAGGVYVDGSYINEGKIFGTHIHGFFDNINIMKAFINAVRAEKGLQPLGASAFDAFRKEKSYDRAAQIVREALDMNKLKSIMGLK